MVEAPSPLASMRRKTSGDRSTRPTTTLMASSTLGRRARRSATARADLARPPVPRSPSVGRSPHGGPTVHGLCRSGAVIVPVGPA